MRLRHWITWWLSPSYARPEPKHTYGRLGTLEVLITADASRLIEQLDNVSVHAGPTLVETVEWYCDPPAIGDLYVVTRERWTDDGVRRIFSTSTIDIEDRP